MNKYLIIELSKYISTRDLLNLSLCDKFLRNAVINNNELWFYLLNRNYKLNREKINHYTTKYNMNNFQLYKNIKIELFTFGSNNGNTPTKVKMKWNLRHGNIILSCSKLYTVVDAGDKLYIFNLNKEIPIEIPCLRNITMVSCSQSHIGIVADRKLYTLSNNDVNILNENSIEIFNIKYSICDLITMLNKNRFSHMVVPSLKNITMVSCGGSYIAIVADGRLYV